MHSRAVLVPAVLVALLLAHPLGAPAARAAWPADGLLVDSVGPDAGRIPPAIGARVDAAGIVIAVGRGHQAHALYRVTADGDPGAGWWPAPIVAGAPVLDGAGGALDFFSAPFSPPRDLFLTRYDAAGALAPGWTTDGVAVCTATGDQAPMIALPDGAGGGFVAWQDARSGGTTSTDLYLHHASADGSPDPAHPGGVRVGTIAQADAIEPRQWMLAPDGQGGVLVAWFAAGTLRVHRFDAALAPAWPGAGFALAPSGGAYGYPEVVADGAGGAYVTLAGVTGDVLLHLDAAGSPSAGWPADGVVLYGAVEPARVASDGAGGILVAWRTATDTRALRFGPAGVAAGWPATGAVLHTSPLPSVIEGLACASDGLGGAVVTVSDGNALVAQRVTAAGAIAANWPANGAVIRVSAYGPFVLRLTALGPGDAVAMWVERWPAGGPYHVDRVYAQRIGAAVPLAVDPGAPGTAALALALAGPSPARGRLVLDVVLPRAAPAMLRLVDVAGRVLESREVGALGAGRHRVALGERGALAPGVYFVSLGQGRLARTLKAVVLR